MNIKRLLVIIVSLGIVAALSAGPVLAAEPEAGAAVEAPGTIEEGAWVLSAEQVAELLARAAAARLKLERDVAASEIKGDLLYEEQAKAAAIRLLQEDAANTQQDNIKRICDAFAAVDEEFAEGYKLFKEGKHDQAAKSTKELLDPQSATYFSAACHYLYAESLFKLGSHEDAVEAYGTVLALMPDRISFASASAARSAEAYEKMNRFYYAAEIYSYCIQNYGLTMSDAELSRIAERLKYLQGIYEDPLGSVAQRMGQVRSSLEKLDSGPKTRDTQGEIVAILEDLIKTAEEKQQQSGGGQGQRKQPKQSSQKSQSDKQAQAKGRQGGLAQGRPTSPAQRGFLPGGIAARPKDLANVRPTEGADDWSKLPPSKRDEIEKATQRLLPERYRQLIRDYRKELSKPSGGSGQ